MCFKNQAVRENALRPPPVVYTFALLSHARSYVGFAWVGGHRHNIAETAGSKISRPFTSTSACVDIFLDVCRSSLLPHFV